MTELAVCTDAHFAWMLGGDAPSPGLRLPPGGVEAAPVMEMLRGLMADIRKTHPVCAWLMVADGEVVGLCSFVRAASDDGIAHIGYGVAESRRKRGHATRAIRLMVDEVLRDPKVSGIAAETAVANIPSQRVLEESGFAKTGTRMDEEDGEVFVWRYKGSPKMAINFKIVGAGWVDCELRLGNRSFILSGISDTTDALGDLLRFALQIATGAYQTTMSFDQEPLEWRLVAVSLLDEASGKGPVSISVFEFSDIYKNSPLSEGHQVFIGDCGALEFAAAVLAEVKRVLPLFGREFSPYPATALRALEAALDWR